MVTFVFIAIVTVSPVTILHALYNAIADPTRHATATSIKASSSTCYLPSVVQRSDLRLPLLLQLFSCFPQPCSGRFNGHVHRSSYPSGQ